ncbi:MAG: hypothetical protein KZQ95_01810 [Candidatus Thiodiazotropha sp. (ex Epidulcina cf. delphinae)]|nr:hypothetical protein [Candidatus Thiodiazotropha sp. (ex Epidulcina cf. delphinae)]
MTWVKLILGGIGKFFGGRFIYVYLLAGAGLLSGSFYAGYSYCDYGWQKVRNGALEEALNEAREWQAKHADAQNALAESSAKREVVYREKIKYVTADAPDCELQPNRLQELVCSVRPSSCQR